MAARKRTTKAGRSATKAPSRRKASKATKTKPPKRKVAKTSKRKAAKPPKPKVAKTCSDVGAALAACRWSGREITPQGTAREKQLRKALKI